MKSIGWIVKAGCILAVIVFALFYSQGVLSQRETLPISRDLSSAEPAGTGDRVLDLKPLWTSKTSSLSLKDLEPLEQGKLNRGVWNLPVVSSFLLREAEKAGEKGEEGRSLQLTLSAAKFSPDLPQPYYELARIRLRQDPIHFYKALPDLLQGLRNQVTYYPSSLNLFFNLFYILSNAFLMAFIVFGIIILWKYLPIYFYDIRRTLTQEISRLLLSSLKVFILLVPFFLRLDILWAILFWLILLWGYAMRKERGVILVFFILIVYIPFFLRSSVLFLDGTQGSLVLEMSQAQYEDPPGSVAQELQTWAALHPDDGEVMFTLGLLEKRQGRYAQAEKYYQGAIQQNPRFSEAYSNLGNVYLLRKSNALAIEAYKKAVNLDPQKGSYAYNLYRAYAQDFISADSDRAYKKANQLDPKLVASLMSIDISGSHAQLQRVLVDEPLSAGKLWKRFLTQFIGKEGVLFRLFRAWFDEIPSRVRSLIPFFFLLFLLAMSRYSKARRFLTRCPMCGSPTHRFYLGASEKEFICFNCHRIFVQKEKLHPKIVEKKSIQAHEFQTQNHFIGKFVSFFLIGFGYLWRGYFLRGFFLLILSFVLILRLVYQEGVVDLSFLLWSHSRWGFILWGGLFVVLYLLSLRQYHRLKPEFRTDPRRDRA